MKPYVLMGRIVLAVFITIISACSAVHAEPMPIKIGFVGDFSSISQAYTRDAYKAAQMAIADFNAQGGLLGRSIELIRRDGGNDPDRHYQHVIELARDKKIAAIFGGASSNCVLKASAACREQQIPYLVSIGNSQSIVVENGHPFVFMFEPNAAMESLGFSIFATLMPWQRYAWIGPDYFWGYDVLASFKHHFDRIGAPVEWIAEIWHPLGTTDFTDSINRIIDSKPEALIVATYGEDLRYFLRQARTARLFEGMAAFGWFSLVTGESERMIPEGIWKISRAPFHYLADKHFQTAIFVNSFKRLYDTYPLDFTICCYDSFLAWRQAILTTESAEPADMAKALKGLSFNGLRGKSFIRPIDGQMNCPTFFGRLVYPPEYAVAVIESVIEIPAVKTWLPESEVRSRRAEKGVQTEKK